MPQMDGTGPEKKGSQTGRGLGKCRTVTDAEAIEKLGKGLGLRRKSGGGSGEGKRLKSGLR
jgi:hypothetical protein